MKQLIDQADKVYVAEATPLLCEDAERKQTFAELEEWLQSLVRRPWFTRRFPQVRELIVADGRGSPCGRGWLDDTGLAHIQLPRALRTKLVAVHELAHAVGNHLHSAIFCADYLMLVKWSLGRNAWRELRNLFQSCGVSFRRPRRPRTYGFEFMEDFHT